MLRKTFILIIFIPLISAVSFASITKEKASVDEVAAVQFPVTAGIRVELENKYLQQILADVITIKGGKIGEILGKFQSNTSPWIWIIGEDDLSENVNGTTQFTSEGALTLLDGDKFNEATDLSVARTIIHEMIHAYLTLYFMNDAANARKDYPAILNAWVISKDPDYNKIQHDEIERSFIDEIALALDEYSDAIGLIDVDNSVYTDLAWGGLDFKNNAGLTSETKRRIQNRLLAEQLNEPSGTETPVAFK